MTAEAREMQSCISEALSIISAKHGRKRAVASLSRTLSLEPRRIDAIVRGEIRRVWADEWNRMRAWYPRFIESEFARQRHALMLERERCIADGVPELNDP